MDQDTTFNVVAVASGYSQVTGLLAGFSFAAIGVLLPRVRPDTGEDADAARQREEEASAAILALLVTFGTLMLASFVYAGVAGPGADEVQVTYLMFYIASALFSMGVCTIFAAIAWLFVVYDLSDSVLAFARLLAYGAIFVATSNLFYSGFLLAHELTSSVSVWQDLPDRMRRIAIFAGFFLAVVLVGQGRMRGPLTRIPTRLHLFRWMMAAVLLITATMGGYVAVLAGGAQIVADPGPLRAALLFGLVVTNLAVGSLCVLSLPPNSVCSDIRSALGRRGR